MALIRYRPAPPLDTYVECFWWSQRNDPQPFYEHMLPGGNAQLIFALHETPIVCLPRPSSTDGVIWSRGVVHGPQWNYFVSGPKPRGAVVGVSFHPGAAGVLLGVPITEVTDRHITIDALWGTRGGGLHARLMEANDPVNVFRVLEQELRARLARPLLIHPAVAHALAPRSNLWSSLRVSDIQRESGYSPKHFIALFRSAVGLTPKHYYRVKRFTTVLRCLASGNAANLADLAASAGYSDQAHLTREFLELAGITPRQYLPRDPDSVLHHQARNSVPGLRLAR
jgi:AraC-like DNA-binding protein